MITIKLYKINEDFADKGDIFVRLEFKLPAIFKWCHLIKISALIRYIKDLTRIFKSKTLAETIHNIKNPSQLPSNEKDGNYIKTIGKI